MNSSILQCHDSSKNWSISTPPLNAERQLETNKSTLANKYNEVRNRTHEINLKANVKDSEFVDKLKTADQCDKKFNSKELIQKQKNWTSHFSKTRTSRYNSDPDKLVVKTSLDKTVLKNKSDEGLQHGSKDSYELENTLENKLSTTNLVKNVNTAERSASFSAMCSSSKTFSSPPQLPTRYSSNGEKKEKKPIACLSVENNELPKFSMLNDIPNNSKKEIPEYAVIQKNVMDKKLDDLPIISLKQCQIESKINSTDTIHACDYKIFQEICADPKNHVAKNKVHVTIDNADYLLSSTIKTPLKTLEKKKLLATKEEIANDVIEFSTTQQSFDKRDLCNKVNENNINALKSRTTKYESDNKPLNSDNFILSYMITSSSPLEKKREEKAEREASEKLKYGKDSYDANKDSSKYENLKTDNSDSYSEINLSSVKRFFNICTDTSTINDKQIHLCLVCNENSTKCEPNEPKSNINESLDLNFINNDNYDHSNIKNTMDISNNLSCTFAFHGKNYATNKEDLNTLDYSRDVSKNLSSSIDLKNNECFPKLLPTTQNTNVIEAKEFNISIDESEILKTCITDCHFQTENIIEIDKANETDLAMELLKHDNISKNVFKQKNNQSDYNILYKKKTKEILHNSTKNVKESSIKNNENDGKLLLEVENKQAINKKPPQNNTETQSSTIALDTSSTQSNKDNLSTRSRSEFTVETVSESQIGSVTSSESDILGSISSLNDTQADTETESQDYTPLGRKIILVENGVHYFEDGHFWMEVAGIPESEDDEEDGCKSISRKTAITFDTGPIRVYSTHSVNEYDRRNEDVDPVAASAEYELEKRVEKMEVFPVELMKGPDGLGLSIIGMGVGADAGLEKLGIFVKTITENGSAAQEGKIQVNDQIVEVDGKSLVGVTQAYAASVLRNTSGLVRFVIGREHDPQNSEVAMLIKQSLQADKERGQDEITNTSRKPIAKDSALYEQHEVNENAENNCRNIQQELLRTGSPAVTSCSESERSQSPSSSYTSFFNNSRSPIISSSANGISFKQNDMDTLRMLLQELVELENNGASSEEYALKLRESGIRLHESERALSATRQDLANVREMLLQLTNQNAIFQQKYARARRAARELRSDVTLRDEFYQQLLQEKDTEYNALVKSLKDRVIILEVELTEIQKRFGMPVRLPYDSATSKIVTPQFSRRQLLPLPSSVSSQLSDTDTSDLNSPDDKDKTDTVERKLPLRMPVKEELDQAIPSHSLLDNSAGKSKAELASRGGLANRQLPKRSGGLSNSSSEYGLDESEDNTDEDLSSKSKEPRNVISKSVNLNLRKKNLSSYLNNSTNLQKRRLIESTIIKQHSTISSQVRALTEQSWQTSPSSHSVLFTEQLEQIFSERNKRLGGRDISISKDSLVNSNELNNTESCRAKIVTRHLVEEIRHAVNEANQRVKSTEKDVTNSNCENTPWYTDGSPSSISSADSSSPPTTEQNVEKNNSGVIFKPQIDELAHSLIFSRVLQHITKLSKSVRYIWGPFLVRLLVHRTGFKIIE
ncbi:uncharacterized protein LOC100116974 isoform X3 [Nasonia vitripennis]|uniref:PDZ domain-containing protein n=2 Tax=Nasonia vitripennis TaxID=7425 RepID=A0A7M7QL56_NASVI|nr:uncharacterized protein LOC100116974 isoform X3 [Nasonia vitripennis]